MTASHAGVASYSIVRRCAAVSAMALWLAACTGCPSPKDAKSTTSALPLEGVRLKLLVIGDPAMAESIGRLRGEWQAQSGAQLEIAQLTEAELPALASIAADAVVYPAYALGPLAERGSIAPIAPEALTDPELEWADIFDHDKSTLVTWGTKAYAVPFGSPTLVCLYRADLLERLDRQPPRTWAEYRQLAELLADRGRLGDAAPPQGSPWCGAIEPLAPGWAGLTLLARAASYARHPNHYSTLFNMNTMAPLVAGPPFVRALEELVEAHRFGPSQADKFGPLDAAQDVLLGRCGLALCWTSAADKRAATTRGDMVRFGWHELPGADEVYNPSAASWEPRADRAVKVVPLLGVSGRLGSVGPRSKNPDAARKLLFWLAGPKWSQRVSPASPATTLFRASQVPSAPQWVDASFTPGEAREYALAVQTSFSEHEVLHAPRIRGRDRYMAALDEAVRIAIAREAAPQAALDEAARRWREITAELGLESQQNAYRRCLGMEP